MGGGGGSAIVGGGRGEYKRDKPPSDEGMELYDADEGITEEEEIEADSENDDELEVDISSNDQSMMDATSDII